MKILEQKVEARECATTIEAQSHLVRLKPKHQLQPHYSPTILDLAMEGPVVCIADTVMLPLHAPPLLMSLPAWIFYARLGGAISACGGIISARTAALASVAGHVRRGTMSPSAQAGAQSKGVNPPLVHKSPEMYPTNPVLLKVVPLPALCMLVHRLPFCSRRLGCKC